MKSINFLTIISSVWRDEPVSFTSHAIFYTNDTSLKKQPVNVSLCENGKVALFAVLLLCRLRREEK